MTIAAKFKRLALCGTLAWLSLGQTGPLSADEDWAPVHIASGRPAANTPAPTPAPAPRHPETRVQTVAFDGQLPASHRGSAELATETLPQPNLPPTFEPPIAAPVGGSKTCRCDRCAGSSPQRLAHTKHATPKRTAKKTECLVYNVLDGVAGGIEHALRLKSPSERCDRSGMQVATCGCELCTRSPRTTGTRRVPAKRAQPMLKRLPTRSSTAVPMPPTVPMQVDTPLVDPPTEPLSHPIEELEPKAVPRLPAPIVPDELSDPFEDDQAWRPGSNPAIKRSAYFE